MRRALLSILLLTAACTSGTVATTPPETIPAITTTSTTLPTGPGNCGTPLLTDERVPDTQLADEIITRFLADRADGLGAEGCLSVTALQVFDESSFPYCLYSCTDIAVLELPETPDLQSAGETTLGPLRSVLVGYQIEDRVHRTMREIYTVQTVRGPGDSRQVLIDSVYAEPETQVTDVAGRQVIEDLLAALADGEWDIAGSLLVNEGTTAAIEARFPDIYTTPFGDLLEPYCAAALCGAPYEIVGSQAVDTFRRSFDVRFETSDGPVVDQIPVGAFEGTLTAGDVPPDGTQESRSTPIAQQLFGDGPPDRLALIRYNSLQLEDGWLPWPSARNAPDAQIVGGRVLFTGFGGVRLATYGSGSVEVQDVIVTTPWRLAGVAMLQDVPTALLTDGRRLATYDLESQTSQILAEADGEQTIGCASVGTGQLLVTSFVEDSTSYDVYDLADLSAVSHFEPEKAAGCGILSPDDSTFVYTADVSLHNPQTIVLASTIDGSDIDRWSVLADAVISSSASTTSLAFDGRYAVADLAIPPLYAPYAESQDIGQRFVVDTETGDQWTVDTAVHVLFPPG